MTHASKFSIAQCIMVVRLSTFVLKLLYSQHIKIESSFTIIWTKTVDQVFPLRFQKQPPEVFCKKRFFLEILQNWQKSTSARVSFLNKIAVLRPETLLKKRFPAVNYYHKVLYLGCCSSPRSASAHSNI